MSVTIKHFFESYKLLENKKVDIEPVSDESVAFKVLSEAIKLYQSTFVAK